MKPFAAIALTVALAGCATADVTLLPAEPGAQVGAVAVFDPKSEAERGVLYQENTKASLRWSSVKPRQADSGAYADLVSVLPPPPAHFTVYFLEGSTDLQPGSDPELRRAFDEVARRPGGEVQITGHTDTLGSDADNDALSRARAQEIRDALVARGDLKAEVTRAAGRGERELLVKTEDGVSEPLNRRVEITVR